MKQIRSTKSYGRSKHINSRVGPVERTDVQASLSLSTDSAGSIRRPGTAHASSEGEESALSAGSKCVKEKVKGHIIVSTSTMIQPPAA